MFSFTCILPHVSCFVFIRLIFYGVYGLWIFLRNYAVFLIMYCPSRVFEIRKQLILSYIQQVILPSRNSVEWTHGKGIRYWRNAPFIWWSIFIVLSRHSCNQVRWNRGTRGPLSSCLDFGRITSKTLCFCIFAYSQIFQDSAGNVSRVNINLD